MTEHFSDLNLIADSVFDIFTDVFTLYTTSWLLCAFLMLWVVRKVVKLFERL